jgi:hypothetical protein
MNSESNLKEYDILGYKVRLLSQEQFSDGERAVALLRKELADLDKKPGSVTEKILVAALKIAADQVKLQEFFTNELDQLDSLLVDSQGAIEHTNNE